MAKKATGLLKCEQLAETPGKPADPDAGGCVTKVVGKFDGGLEPTKGCFEKLESKNPNDCITFDDTAAAEAAVDSCVAAFVAAIDPPDQPDQMRRRQEEVRLEVPDRAPQVSPGFSDTRQAERPKRHRMRRQGADQVQRLL